MIGVRAQGERREERVGRAEGVLRAIVREVRGEREVRRGRCACFIEVSPDKSNADTWRNGLKVLDGLVGSPLEHVLAYLNVVREQVVANADQLGMREHHIPSEAISGLSARRAARA